MRKNNIIKKHVEWSNKVMKQTKNGRGLMNVLSQNRVELTKIRNKMIEPKINNNANKGNDSDNEIPFHQDGAQIYHKSKIVLKSVATERYLSLNDDGVMDGKLKKLIPRTIFHIYLADNTTTESVRFGDFVYIQVSSASLVATQYQKGKMILAQSVVGEASDMLGKFRVVEASHPHTHKRIGHKIKHLEKISLVQDLSYIATTSDGTIKMQKMCSSHTTFNKARIFQAGHFEIILMSEVRMRLQRERDIFTNAKQSLESSKKARDVKFDDMIRSNEGDMKGIGDRIEDEVNLYCRKHYHPEDHTHVLQDHLFRIGNDTQWNKTITTRNIAHPHKHGQRFYPKGISNIVLSYFDACMEELRSRGMNPLAMARYRRHSIQAIEHLDIHIKKEQRQCTVDDLRAENRCLNLEALVPQRAWNTIKRQRSLHTSNDRQYMFIRAVLRIQRAWRAHQNHKWRRRFRSADNKVISEINDSEKKFEFSDRFIALCKAPKRLVKRTSVAEALFKPLLAEANAESQNSNGSPPVQPMSNRSSIKHTDSFMILNAQQTNKGQPVSAPVRRWNSLRTLVKSSRGSFSSKLNPQNSPLLQTPKLIVPKTPYPESDTSVCTTGRGTGRLLGSVNVGIPNSGSDTSRGGGNNDSSRGIVMNSDRSSEIHEELTDEEDEDDNNKAHRDTRRSRGAETDSVSGISNYDENYGIVENSEDDDDDDITDCDFVSDSDSEGFSEEGSRFSFNSNYGGIDIKPLRLSKSQEMSSRLSSRPYTSGSSRQSSSRKSMNLVNFENSSSNNYQPYKRRSMRRRHASRLKMNSEDEEHNNIIPKKSRLAKASQHTRSLAVLQLHNPGIFNVSDAKLLNRSSARNRIAARQRSTRQSLPGDSHSSSLLSSRNMDQPPRPSTAQASLRQSITNPKSTRGTSSSLSTTVQPITQQQPRQSLSTRKSTNLLITIPSDDEGTNEIVKCESTKSTIGIGIGQGNNIEESTDESNNSKDNDKVIHNKNSSNTTNSSNNNNNHNNNDNNNNINDLNTTDKSNKSVKIGEDSESDFDDSFLLMEPTSPTDLFNLAEGYMSQRSIQKQQLLQRQQHEQFTESQGSPQSNNYRKQRRSQQRKSHLKSPSPSRKHLHSSSPISNPYRKTTLSNSISTPNLNLMGTSRSNYSSIPIGASPSRSPQQQQTKSLQKSRLGRHSLTLTSSHQLKASPIATNMSTPQQSKPTTTTFKQRILEQRPKTASTVRSRKRILNGGNMRLSAQTARSTQRSALSTVQRKLRFSSGSLNPKTIPNSLKHSKSDAFGKCGYFH
eukprot:TRINITY_DN12057_c0_g1_i2.p1 TRINITY_DN12057_c0_g1~~TRINITY_DN12057_c0_g1_i2.p1  ORF type:complete len:1293 (-),score=332.89 TRINITY_DN12057_c0_g1_i2:114-3992(-)